MFGIDQCGIVGPFEPVTFALALALALGTRFVCKFCKRHLFLLNILTKSRKIIQIAVETKTVHESIIVLLVIIQFIKVSHKPSNFHDIGKRKLASTNSVQIVFELFQYKYMLFQVLFESAVRLVFFR